MIVKIATFPITLYVRTLDFVGLLVVRLVCGSVIISLNGSKLLFHAPSKALFRYLSNIETEEKADGDDFGVLLAGDADKLEGNLVALLLNQQIPGGKAVYYRSTQTVSPIS